MAATIRARRLVISTAFIAAGARQRHPLGHRAGRPRGPRPDVLRRRQADDRLRGVQRGESGGGSAGRQGRRRRRDFSGLRPRRCPLQPQRHARHELLRRRQADDRLRGGERGGASGGRQDRRGRQHRLQLRPRPLQPERHARHELLRRRQADDRLRGRAKTRRPEWRSRGTARSSSSVPPRTPPPAANPKFAIARYNPNGSLDTSFSGDGKQTTDFGATRDGATGVALQGDGKIVAVGAAGSGASHQRLRPRPLQPERLRSIRASPATASRRPTSAASTRRTGWRSRADGKIVAVGDTESSATGGGFALARYNPNGALDPSFSGDGKQTTTGVHFFEANGVAIQSDGKIVAVGGALRPRPLQPQRLA